jgi:RNA polymerase sigma factor (sigma-70 family)
VVNFTNHIVTQCKRGQPDAQRKLYDIYKDILFAICLRYLKTREDAEDVFIEGFYKIYDKINNFKGDGSFEGWMKRIMINESLQFLRRKKQLLYPIDIGEIQIADTLDNEDDWTDGLDIGRILASVNDLPDGYRTVFNMYVFDEYKHREIAEVLGISINTSKSQYLLAKKRILESLQSSNKNQVLKKS